MFAERHTIKLPRFPAEPSLQKAKPATPKEVAQQWITKLESVLKNKDAAALSTVMHTDCWLRDMLAFSWDIRTIHGLDNLAVYFGDNWNHSTLSNLRIRETGKFSPSTSSPIEGLEWLESMFDFDTTVGKGSGMLRLVQGPDGVWKGYMIYTALQELKDFQQQEKYLRPHGGLEKLPGGAAKGNWFERRQRQMEFLDEDPTVLCLGAGQSGLNMAARLQAMGVSALIVDKNKRVGDNWRSRYRTLVTHDPVQYTHMAFLPFPSNWPLFTPKDKLGDWFESYANLMELNVWTQSTITSSTYDDNTHTWTVEIQRGDGSTRTLHPKHIILCTGHAGEALIPSFPGQDTFQGKVYHASFHQDAAETGSAAGKKVVVVGTGNSGHDIAQNYYENGAQVTMLQRRGTYVISAAKGLFMLHEGMYDEGGPPTEDADIAGQSLPIPVQFALNVDLTKRIAEAEKENVEGLTKAGFKIDFGEDGSGIYRKYITRGGGYYIDVGCSKLIIEGKIAVKQSPGGISHFEPNKLVLATGERLDADVVVLATGYDNMRTSARKIFGDKVADRCKDVWDLDEEGEVNAMWRPSGHPGFWFMGGSLALARQYSRFVALQIKAIEAGLTQR
ncbi:putative flavin-containing monooxygenase YUCCA3 [Mollisia scopiformis]|uniref:Putative flavin-containing monooxygenase YUCCA3 n=1 Tax=Mollisia scopiformis TaxID=149040 RepID=A0A194WT46_MOLSC|nr:putative flavin-containing monooxygenase YUCCA3 [Mollisia scopiformis]KUJ10839.1 putative flavin-containing monooxygenase YUCCA3 [Mollisia scopiformis]